MFGLKSKEIECRKILCTLGIFLKLIKNMERFQASTKWKKLNIEPLCPHHSASTVKAQLVSYLPVSH